MGHVVGVPAFRQHGHGDHTSDLLAKPAFLADRVHHFPQYVCIREILRAVALRLLPAKCLDLLRMCLAECLVYVAAGFQSGAVDEDGAWPR